MERVYNFSAGPAVLPIDVLKEAAEEMLNYKGTGMSVMEMSHRSKAYDTIINNGIYEMDSFDETSFSGKINVKNDNSDSKISDIIIQGLVMGIIDITKKIDTFVPL